jgi:hypothetical protein
MIVPADIGFEFNAGGKPAGISALHTHDESGIIHVKAPVGDTYTMGQLLTEWGVLDGTGPTTGTAAPAAFRVDSSGRDLGHGIRAPASRK